MAAAFDPHEMLTAKEMAKVMRISARDFRRKVTAGEIPPGRAYMGGRPRWPAFLAYYLVFAELVTAWEAETGRAQKGQTRPNAAK